MMERFSLLLKNFPSNVELVAFFNKLIQLANTHYQVSILKLPLRDLIYEHDICGSCDFWYCLSRTEMVNLKGPLTTCLSFRLGVHVFVF